MKTENAPAKKTNRTTMVVSISLTPSLHRAAVRKAASDKRALSTYLQMLMERDLGLIKPAK